jgi:hypothetical protein
LTSCFSVRSAELDASGSYDPEYHKLAYEWSKVSGPFCTIFNVNSPKARADDLEEGQYVFELKVTDTLGLSSKDNVVVNVKGSPLPIEVDLDVNINEGYNFKIGNFLSLEMAAVYAAYANFTTIVPHFPL